MKDPYCREIGAQKCGKWLVLCGFFGAITACLNAQPPQLDQIAQRGVVPGLSYATSETETISTANGDLLLKVPLVSLPRDRGGQAAELNLVYNSKLYDLSTKVQQDPTQSPPPGACNPLNSYGLNVGDGAGWRYAFQYEIRVLKRSDHYIPSQSCQPQCTASITPTATNNWRYQLVFPDGSVHELTPRGYSSNSGDGFYGRAPDGTKQVCALQAGGGYTLSFSADSSPLTFYTTDGTYARVDATAETNTGASFLNNWTLSFADGRRVVNVPGTQSIFSRNGVAGGFSVQITSGTDPQSGLPSHTIQDSAGRTITVVIGTTGTDTITAKGAAGAPLTWSVKWVTVSSSQQYQPYDSWPQNPPIQNVTLPESRAVQEIDLPTETGGLKYIFDYGGSIGTDLKLHTSNSGELRSVQLPSGATSAYQYSLDGQTTCNASTCTPYSAFPNNTVKQKDLTHDGSTDTWHYSISTPPLHGASITAPDGGITVETLNFGGSPIRTAYPDGSEVDRVWNENIPTSGTQPLIPPSSVDPSVYTPLTNPFVSMEFHTVADSAHTKTKTAVTTTTVDFNGNTTGQSEFDWIQWSSILKDPNTQIPYGIPTSGTTIRRTIASTFYVPAFQSGDLCTHGFYCDSSAAQTMTLPKSHQITGGGSGSRTEYCYDNAATRGNLTLEAHWDSTVPAQPNSAAPTSASTLISDCSLGRNGVAYYGLATFSAFLSAGSTTSSYDNWGNPTAVQDGRQLATQYTYGDVGGQSNLYPTMITRPDGSTNQRGYDLYTGSVKSETDSNTYPSSVTTTTTLDVFGRPSLITRSDRTTELDYSDTARYVITKTDLISANDRAQVTVKRFDQLGRVRLTQELEAANPHPDTDESAGIKVQHVYSATPAFELTSSPYRSLTDASETTVGWTRTKFDQMGRKSEIETFTGSAQPTATSAGFGPAKIQYVSDTTTITDEQSKSRVQYVDALGRLIEVMEDPNGDALETDYTYDALDNLTGVTQGTQTRTFTYDSLKRLTTATNPETGAISYTYDGDGNVLTKTDGRGVVTNFAYDSLNRLQTKGYTLPNPNPPAATPNATPVTGTSLVTYCYDGTVYNSQSGACSSASPAIPYARGRLTGVGNAVSATAYAGYNPHGQVTLSTQTLPGTNPYVFSYGYSLAGGLSSITYPSQRTVTYDFDAAGRVNRVEGYTDANTQSLIQYAPHGGISSLKFTGSGLVETSGYNAKLQVTSIQAGSLLSLSYVYNATQNNGNLVSQTITRGSSSWTMNYTMPDGTSGYDGMNRLKAANETGGWTESYGYDRWGNRWLSETGLPALNDETPKTSSWYLGNNQITGWTYDGAGNLTKVGSMSRVFSYDAENRQTQAVINGTASSYAYDGDGRRVQAVTPSGTTTYVYDAAGQLAAEYSTVPGTATGRQYVTADALGSTRLLSDGNAQTVVKAFDYLPFGGELLAGTGARTTAMGFNDSTSVQVPDKVSMKFTGKERDAETGLDYFGARYFSAAQGRFTSPDPKQFTDRALEYPQKWNKYAYTQNNPLIFIDPDGKDDIAAAACLDRGSCIQKLAASRGTRGSFVATGALGAAAALFFGGEIAAGARGLWYSVSTYLMTPKGQHTAASVLEGLSDAPPGSLTNDFARLGRTTAESVEKKLSTYLLDMAHPKGGDKAAWFEAALGFTKENMGGLAKQLVFDEGKAFVTQVTEYGTKYNQVINITGTNGKTIAVTVGWIRHPDGVVRLVTAIPSAR